MTDTQGGPKLLDVVVPSSLRPPLEALRARLRGIFGERLRDVRLFGSYARGEADEDSDVDVLIVVDDLTTLEVGLVADAAAPIIVETGIALAPLPMSTAHLAELRRAGRALVIDLDREGISL